VLQDINHLEVAIGNYDRAIALKPDFAEAYCNRGNAQQAMMRLRDAVESFNGALNIKRISLTLMLTVVMRC